MLSSRRSATPRDMMSVIFTVMWSGAAADHAVSKAGMATSFEPVVRIASIAVEPWER
jgi:hypothetical protein